MRVFDFTLLSGYEFSGVDVAQGFRARLFAKNNVNAKFIFTELPTIRDMELYGSQKIKRGQIMSAHLFMTGRLDMSLSVKKEALLENEKENYEYDNIDEDGKVIRLYNSGEKSVEILCDEDGFVINESLFKNGKKYLENYYTDSLSYTELYNWDNDSNDGLNLGRRIFWNKQGQMVYEQCIYKDNVEYLFKNGEVIDNVEFLERFVKTLNLCENDICIMDRAGYLDYIQPLFENKGKSKLIAVLHSDHFYKIYEDESSLYMNYEYYYWFKYSEAIDYFVVGTDEHKRSLEAFLKEYDCFVPHIAAIPPGAIPEGKLKSKNNRWQGSIISASRLSPRKGIDILIKSVIKAHEINQTINLDIYGSGNDEYTSYLQNIVKDAGADDYIHFKGRCNLEKIYPHYELFASFSLWETFGLSLMEAVGDGLAMVGLDGDTWQVRWKEFLSDSYVYGSKIEFNEDGSVSYKNRLMPPGTVIHTWYSMTNFQGNRIEPSLPLIDGERAYSIAVNIDYHNSESEALMLRIIFFDRYDVQAQSIIVRDKKAFFKPSIRTYSYRIELINGGNADFTFKSLVIKEVSEEEFDAEQERIERLKEDSNKSKKKRRKNKKSK